MTSGETKSMGMGLEKRPTGRLRADIKVRISKSEIRNNIK